MSIGARLSHLPNVDEVKSPRPRQAGSMLMASANIEADASCTPGDPLTPVLRKHAATYAERVRTEAPEYMQQVGAGGELVPASMLGENSRALTYRSTVDRPDCVAIEASGTGWNWPTKRARSRWVSILPTPSKPTTAWKKCSSTRWRLLITPPCA